MDVLYYNLAVGFVIVMLLGSMIGGWHAFFAALFIKLFKLVMYDIPMAQESGKSIKQGISKQAIIYWVIGALIGVLVIWLLLFDLSSLQRAFPQYFSP